MQSIRQHFELKLGRTIFQIVLLIKTICKIVLLIKNDLQNRSTSDFSHVGWVEAQRNPPFPKTLDPKGKHKMTIQPQGEDLRKAVKWVSEERQSSPGQPLNILVEKACHKFDLSPKDSDFLMRCLMEQGNKEKCE